MYPQRVALTRKELQLKSLWMNYREKKTTRGGGESGSNDWTNSVAAKLKGAAMAWAGWEMIAASGSRKITADVREGLLSWQQDIEQLAKALPP